MTQRLAPSVAPIDLSFLNQRPNMLTSPQNEPDAAPPVSPVASATEIDYPWACYKKTSPGVGSPTQNARLLG